MKFNLALIFSIIIASGLVSFGFTYYQISTERAKLNNELEAKIKQVVQDIYQGDYNFLDSISENNIEKFAKHLSVKYGLKGVAIYGNENRFIGNQEIAQFKGHSVDYATQSLAADTAFGNFISIDGKETYQYIQPITRDHLAASSVILYADAEYIDNIIGDIWFRNFLRWFFQAFIVSIITVLIMRYGIFSPINRIVNWVKSARMGDVEELEQNPPAKFLAPLHKEITHIARAMNEAKAAAEEEAKLRSKSEAIWTPERLKIEMRNLLHNRMMVVVSNREPYMHIRSGKEIKCIVPASGMITAMEPILKACGGLWIAAASGDADKETVDENNRLRVPPEEPKYTLKRLWLTKEEEDHYYYGFSNEGIWPLCHIAHTRPIFRIEDWSYYQKVNEDFANAVLEETADEEQPLILIQDYHFALLPELIKMKKPKARVAIFWHIPWPNPESFGICPWQKEILTGLLGADLIGFHTQYHCNHFLETVNNSLESRVLWERFSVKMGGHTTLIKPFPISIDFTMKDLNNEEKKPDLELLMKDHGIKTKFIGIGVDRLDYTKGIIEKFLAVELFLEQNPAYQGKFTFIQIGAPSRTSIKSYADTAMAIEKEADRINMRFKAKNWKPILLLKKHHSHAEIQPYYKAALFCMVTSLHDGMNLVAKEFVSQRNDNDGVLILSRFAGASQKMQGAIVINPYDTEKSANAIKQALEMPAEEQLSRMQSMRKEILSNNIYSWAADLLRTMASIR
ncbi:MAG: trehalose-6-phosphate synthase [Bacteroidetes bacterium]|nr:trehalose-6-phosphate synthase [Bacteroidota bacterium]